MYPNFQNTIYLTGLEVFGFLAVCLLIVYFARPEIALGIYLSMGDWTRTVQIGPIAHTWVLVGTILLATFVMLIRNRDAGFSIPNRNRWILFLLALWWSWMTLLFFLYKDLFIPQQWSNLWQIVTLYVLFPLPFILLLPRSLDRVQWFAFAYIAFAILEGWFALQVINIPVSFIAKDPTLISFGVLRLNVVNYHWFAYPFAISLIFVLVLFFQTNNLLWRIICLLVGIYCVYFLVLAGSRQTIVGVLAAMIVFGLWMMKSRGNLRIWLMIVLSIFLYVSIWLVQVAPSLLRLNGPQGQLSLDISFLKEIIQDRSAITWEQGLRIIPDSPIWGFGFSLQNISHNLFIGTLVDQGIVGLIFLICFLIFWGLEAKFVWEATRVTVDNLWRVAMVLVMVFVLIQSQFSGNPIAEWAMWWSTVFLWQLNAESVVNKENRNLFIASVPYS